MSHRTIRRASDGVYARSGIWESSAGDDLIETGLLPDWCADFPLDDPAFRCILLQLMSMRCAGVEITPEVREIAVKLGRQEYETATNLLSDPRSWVNRERSVYFIRHGDHVKIGTTINGAHRRLKDMQLPPGAELVAVVPKAGFDEERDLHRRFKASRVHGEWFTSTPELESLIQTFSITPACPK